MTTSKRIALFLVAGTILIGAIYLLFFPKNKEINNLPQGSCILDGTLYVQEGLGWKVEVDGRMVKVWRPAGRIGKALPHPEQEYHIYPLSLRVERIALVKGEAGTFKNEHGFHETLVNQQGVEKIWYFPR